jgi:predicted dienelactone hydrolase
MLKTRMTDITDMTRVAQRRRAWVLPLGITCALLLVTGTALLFTAKCEASAKGPRHDQTAFADKRDVKQAYYPNAAVQEVSVISDLVLHDAARDKDLHVRVYYPQTGGNHPVIVFSHGAGGSQDVAPELLKYWASHGYVVLAPTHDDSIKLRKKAGERMSMAGIIKEFGSDPELRVSRVSDDSFIIDMLPQLPKLAPELNGKLDISRVGVGGHSAGAMTAMLIGGAVNDMAVNGPGGIETGSLSDKRVRCILVLSGQGISGALGCFDKHSWDGVSVPMMVMTGSLDGSTRTGQTAQSRRDPYLYAPAGNKYLLFIEGAAHSSFTGGMTSNAGLGGGRLVNAWLGAKNSGAAGDYSQDAIFEYVEMSSLVFWDAHLKGDAAAAKWIKSPAIDNYSGGQVEYQWK